MVYFACYHNLELRIKNRNNPDLTFYSFEARLFFQKNDLTTNFTEIKLRTYGAC